MAIYIVIFWCFILNTITAKAILVFVTGLCLTPCLLQANVEAAAEFLYGDIILSSGITTLFLVFVFLILIMINRIYRKKALTKIKRAFENDID